MHYYQFNIGDYRRATSHLTLLEHAIYRALTDTYILFEEPLCTDHAKLMRAHCVRSTEEQKAFENVLEDFFTLTEKGYVNEFCEQTIAGYQGKSTQAAGAANARWRKHREKMREGCERTADGMPTINQKPLTRKPLTRKPRKSQPDINGTGVTQETIDRLTDRTWAGETDPSAPVDF